MRQNQDCIHMCTKHEKYLSYALDKYSYKRYRNNTEMFTEKNGGKNE